jgi:hypothetical protein
VHDSTNRRKRGSADWCRGFLQLRFLLDPTGKNPILL